MKIAFLALGIYEKSDSVGYDCVYEYRLLRERMPDLEEIRIFAEHYDEALYPDIGAAGVDAFLDWCRNNEDGIVVFHYCDSRSRFDEFLRERRAPVVIRWHNNTPPWFTFGSQNQNAMHALTGYENLIDYIRAPNTHFWVNSDFTRDQLLALGGRPDRCSTVFPASRYLEVSGIANTVTRKTTFAERGIDLLFVGRVVAHKGHRNAVYLADHLGALIGRPVTLHFVGKGYDDPNAFTKELRGIIAASSTRVVMHGQVSEEKLADLYADADVFVCLSEHEGFGLPVFEAMRCRVPVVAWATTAFEELLDIHPLAFRHFDLDVFASAIASLQSPEVRQQVLEVQYCLLQRYKAPLVENQIVAALGEVVCSWSQRPAGDLARPPIFRHPRIGAALSDLVETANRLFPQKFDDTLVYDSHSNITSLYDLGLVNTYITLQKDLFRAALDNTARPVVRFSADEFSGRNGVADGPDAYIYPNCHVIYGPYVEVPRGSYIAEFDLIITVSQTNPVSFTFDINSYGGECLAKKTIILKSGRHVVTAPMFFDLSRGQGMVEFRVEPHTSFRGVIDFSGVDVSKADAGSKASTLLERLANIFSIKGKLSDFLMRRHFRMADHFRDNREWTAAAAHYKAGLAKKDNQFGYLVQLGHVLKESKRYMEAEHVYLRALAVRPDDLDLKLQLGHFYKITHNSTLARKYYEEVAKYNESISDIARASLLDL